MEQSFEMKACDNIAVVQCKVEGGAALHAVVHCSLSKRSWTAETAGVFRGVSTALHIGEALGAVDNSLDVHRR